MMLRMKELGQELAGWYMIALVTCYHHAETSPNCCTCSSLPCLAGVHAPQALMQRGELFCCLTESSIGANHIGASVLNPGSHRVPWLRLTVVAGGGVGLPSDGRSLLLSPCFGEQPSRDVEREALVSQVHRVEEENQQLRLQLSQSLVQVGATEGGDGSQPWAASVENREAAGEEKSNRTDCTKQRTVQKCEVSHGTTPGTAAPQSSCMRGPSHQGLLGPYNTDPALHSSPSMLAGPGPPKRMEICLEIESNDADSAPSPPTPSENVSAQPGT